MKKKIVLCFIVGLFTFLIPAGKADAAITESEMQGNPMDNENHFIWDVMTQLQTPDDADCATVAETYLSTNGVTDATQRTTIASNACSGIAEIKTSMSGVQVIGNETIETNLTSATDWHSVENLYFQHSTDSVTDGRIAFTQPIDFMSYAFMTFMHTFGQRMESSQGRLSLDADIVGGLRGYGAILTMYNVGDFNNPEILVNGEEDTDSVVSGLVYDRENQSITFNAAHFTTFEAVESGTSPSIDKVKATQYTTLFGRKMLRVVVDGDNFQKNATVKLGNREAKHVTWKKNGKQLIAHFNIADIERSGRKRLTVRVVNSNGLEETHSEKLNFYRVIGKLF